MRKRQCPFQSDLSLALGYDTQPSAAVQVPSAAVRVTNPSRIPDMGGFVASTVRFIDN